MGRPRDAAPGCDCSGVNTFSAKAAEDDLRRYLRQGPDRTTRALIEAIRNEGVEGATLLDIGGGVGTIPLELLAAGLATVQAVDASEAYLATARAEVERRGLGDRVRHRLGLLEQVAAEIEPADIVTLDRVVCCDRDLPALLGAVTTRARRIIGLVYPRPTWWNRVAARALNAFGWLTRDPTRWYLHPAEELDATLRRAGFERRDVDRSIVWQVALYVRTTADGPAPA